VIIPDALKPADTAWKPYKNPQVITAENAKSITSFDKSDVESMVTYFYASKIRGDDDWKKVLEPENTWSKRMLYSLDKYEKWTFTAFRLDRKKMHAQDWWWINVHFEIEVSGETDGGFDEVSATNSNGTRIITEVPN
jgi:hypothetical protein